MKAILFVFAVSAHSSTLFNNCIVILSFVGLIRREKCILYSSKVVQKFL